MKFVPALTSLRFFGALSVIFLHLGSKQIFIDIGLERFHILISGITGVVLFYVLSGFLLTNLALQEIRNTNSFDFKKFFFRRALRLFPLYYLSIFAILLLGVFGVTRVKLVSFLYAMFYSFNFVPRDSYNGHLGSFHTLATEEHFYLFFAALFAISTMSLGKWARFAIPMILLGIVVSVDQLRPTFATYSDDYFVARWTIFAIKPILVGCLAAFVYSSDTFRAFLRLIQSHPRIDAAFGLLLLIVFAGLYVGLAYHRSYSIAGIGFASFFVFLCRYSTSYTARILSFGPLVYLGTISYGLYVWQAVIIGTGGSSRWIPSGPASAALILVVSVLSYEYYEKWFLVKKSRYKVAGVPNP